MKQEISIIIINYNNTHLNETINSIKKFANVSYQIILVDNNSNNSPEFNDPQITIIKNKQNLGFGKANNQGIRIAKGKYILLLNPDINLKKDTIKKTINFMEKSRNVKIAGCKLLNEDGSLQYSCRTFPTPLIFLARNTPLKLLFKQLLFKHDMCDYDHETTRKVDWISGAFMMLRDKYYFNESFFLYLEDVDLCRRVGNVYYFPEAEAIHVGSYGSSKNFKLFLIHLKSIFYYFRKHGFK